MRQFYDDQISKTDYTTGLTILLSFFSRRSLSSWNDSCRKVHLYSKH